MGASLVVWSPYAVAKRFLILSLLPLPAACSVQECVWLGASHPQIGDIFYSRFFAGRRRYLTERVVFKRETTAFQQAVSPCLYFFYNDVTTYFKLDFPFTLHICLPCSYRFSSQMSSNHGTKPFYLLRIVFRNVKR